MEQQRGYSTQWRTWRTAIGLVAFTVGMLALSFIAAPAYRAFCTATGIAGATKRASVAPTESIDRTIVVRFDSNTSPGLTWRFEPEVTKVKIRVGEVATVYYRVENLSDQETRGLASFNVSPGQAGPYFNKLACFCFQEQTLGPHEKAEWPVVFFLDPKLQEEPLMDGVEEVTLSYTFFAAKGKTAQGGEGAQGKNVGLN
ncbi:cytochrome c oxidase assembly protein [Methylocystis bryophila]|uniref:Cytochrome c oxidase assembly protein CtaG n=1 Tax=Methylocystis bryophila TaxID=655015 RepID=A0A1W6MZ25_9HYPH|nr:cytochrome c oxidase assembly protein [Methylocystis bryophila]ARN82796.1 cytochrome c oxidase assembly protein [Methylocystis bryophila]BDV39041.1 cytochrome c oxidase assembly protein CtaG [Methylocystis bryophila]